MLFLDKIKARLNSNPQFATSNIDKTYWFIYFVLVAAAFMALFSASATLVYKSGSALAPVGHQVFFLLVGAVAAWVIQFIKIEQLSKYCHWVLYALIVMLYLMIIPNSPFVKSINGAGRWFVLFGFSFQPSEFAKVALVMTVADILSQAKNDEDMRRAFYHTLILSAITIFPIMIGNLSTAILMAGIVYLLWFIARVNWRNRLATLGISISVLLLGYFIVEFAFVRPGNPLPDMFQRASVWVNRVDDLIEEKKSAAEGKEFELNDDNYQRSLAKVAIARGGKTLLFGVGPGNSKERNYLPLAYADYIFAIIVEETGLFGAGFLIFIYLSILFRACLVSSRFGSMRAMLMTMGLALMLTCQALISMMVAVGIGPVTGQPLPMITMGGTSCIATALYFGVMMAVSREQNQVTNHNKNVKEKSLKEVPDLD